MRMKKEWYSLTDNQLFEELNTSDKGLTSKECQKRQQKYVVICSSVLLVVVLPHLYELVDMIPDKFSQFNQYHCIYILDRSCFVVTI